MWRMQTSRKSNDTGNIIVVGCVQALACTHFLCVKVLMLLILCGECSTLDSSGHN